MAAYVYVIHRNFDKAEESFQDAFASTEVEMGSSAASVLGEMYVRFGLRRPESEDILVKVLQPLAEKGNARAMFVLGYLAETSPERDNTKHEEARKWYRRAAEAGMPAGQMRLSLLCLSGDPSEKDRKEARNWLEELARFEGVNTDPLKHFARALLYYHGLDRDTDKAKAVEILDIEGGRYLGYAPADIFAARMYEKGEGGLNRDEQRARRLYENASKKSASAAWKAAEFWNTGKGCERNIYEAARYYEWAWALGVVEAEKKLKELRKEFQERYAGELPDIEQ